MLVFRAREEMSYMEFISQFMGNSESKSKMSMIEEYKGTRFPFLSPEEAAEVSMRDAMNKIFDGRTYEVDTDKVDKSLAKRSNLKRRMRR